MSYIDALRYLDRHTNYEFTPLDKASAATLDLRRVRDLLTRLGEPQRGRRTVHITGSKGKGSTAVMIATLLQRAGYRTALFTSPHLHRETERYRVDGEPIPEAALIRLVEELQPHVQAVNEAGEYGRLTTFELRVALAFLWFREQQAEWQVIEVGLGGRLDATNVLDEKELCVFTPVSLEHTAILGDTPAKIARDKSGILRKGTRAVMSLQRESAADIFREACAALDVPLLEVAVSCRMAPGPADLDGQEVRLQTPRGDYRFKLALLGRHQLENAATAVLAVESLPGIDLTPVVVREAMAAVRWPGRLEVLKRAPLLVVDGAHNGDSARRLVQALRSLASYRRLILVVGMNADKDISAFAREFSALEPEIIATRSIQPRAAAAEAVMTAFFAEGMQGRAVPSVAAAVDDALNEAGPGDLICVTGSLFVVAEARSWVLGVVPDPPLSLH